jgi:hypothetical protein
LFTDVRPGNCQISVEVLSCFVQLTPAVRAQRSHRPANHITERNTPRLAPAVTTLLKDAYRGRCTRCGFENVGRRDRRLPNLQVSSAVCINVWKRLERCSPYFHEAVTRCEYQGLRS